MEENNRQSEEFLPQLAVIADYLNSLSPSPNSVGIELELNNTNYYNSIKEVTNITNVISTDIDSRYILYIDNVKFTIIKVNK